MRYTFIAVEGPIGVGKTSLAERLADHFDDAKLVLESFSNPFLEDFYSDLPGSAFRAQLHFLLGRFEQLKDLSQRELFRRRIISDFAFEKDRIFAHLNLTDSELTIYEKLYGLLAPQVPEPDAVIYLTAEPATLKRRIRRRGRPFERGIDVGYLQEVARAYNYYFFNYTRTPLLVINTDEIDFVRREEDLTDLIEQVNAIDTGTRYYVPRR